jgi:rhodanese-related sulfurtransferase
MISFLSARSQVQSTTYDLMLKTLLSHDVKEISVMQLKKMKNVLLLDAREVSEYQVSHLSGARQVGYDKFDISVLKDVSKDRDIVVYCSVGYRSEKIAERLVEGGYTRVSNLYGGIFEWVNQGNEVVDMSEKKTDRVHAYSSSWGVWLNKGIKVYDK